MIKVNDKTKTNTAQLEAKGGTKRFYLTADMANAAFDEDAGAEIARILREAADKAENGDIAGTLRDVNGNTVGKFSVTTAK